MSLADYDKPLPSANTTVISTVVPIKQATTPLGYIAGAIQKLVFKDLLSLARAVEGNWETDLGRAESLLAWAEKFENPEQSK